MVGVATKSANTVVHKGTPNPKAVAFRRAIHFADAKHRVARLGADHYVGTIG